MDKNSCSITVYGALAKQLEGLKAGDQTTLTVTLKVSRAESRTKEEGEYPMNMSPGKAALGKGKQEHCMDVRGEITSLGGEAPKPKDKPKKSAVLEAVLATKPSKK